MKRPLLLYLLTVLLLTACGDDKNSFVIKGTLNNLGGRPLYAVYKTDKSIVIDTLRPDDGRIELRGSSEERIPIQLYNSSMQPFMRLYMQNGEQVELNGDAKAIYEIKMKGSSLNRELWQWICEHNEILTSVEAERMRTTRMPQNTFMLDIYERKADSVLIDYIEHHHGSELSSILLGDYLLRYNNFQLCDSLWQKIDEDARLPYIARTMERLKEELSIEKENARLPHLRFFDDNDSLFFVNPRKSKATLLYIWAADDARSENGLKELERLSKVYRKEQLQVVALSIDRDTAVWHKAIADDSTRVIHMRCESAYNNKVMQPHHITRLPVVMLGDSLGNILVRTAQLPDADISEQTDSLVTRNKYKLETPIFKP